MAPQGPPQGPPSGAGGPPPGMMGPPDPKFIPSPPSELASSLSVTFAGTAIALNIIAFIIFCGRIATRTIPTFRLQWDDLIFSIAYALVLTDSVLLLATVPYVFWQDPNSVTLADVEEGFKLALFAQPIWTWAMAAIKIGIASMLLRLQQERGWCAFLWTMVAVQLVMAVYNTFAQLLQCIPLSGSWDLLSVSKAKCWSDEAIRSSSIAVSAVNIVTDIIFSLIPITFLRKVQRPLRERIIIGILMALGLFASGASIAKVVAASRFGTTKDPTAEGINVGMWSCIEELVGFIAACIPCLKSPFQRVLSHFGLISSNTKTTYSGAGAYKASYGKMTDRLSPSHAHSLSGSGYPAGIRMKSLRSTDNQSEEDILYGDESKDGIWCTTEVQLQEERIGGVVRVRAADLQNQVRPPPKEEGVHWHGRTKHQDNECWADREA